MAHHQAPKQPQDEGKNFGDFKVVTTGTTKPNLNHSSREVAKEEQRVQPHEKKSLFDYQIAGFAWPFIFIMSILVIGVLGMILKVMGMF
jgi:hypothetical protein